MEVIGIDYGSEDKTVYCRATNGPSGVITVREFGEVVKRAVCAKRGRTLRKRGERIQFSHNTSTGKARYVWWRMTPNAAVNGRRWKD